VLVERATLLDEMRRLRFSALFIALLVSVAVPASALLSCMADQSDSAMTQMACCKTAKPDCGTSSKGTMECCKTGDHPDQQSLTKVPTITNPLKTAFISVAVTLVQQPLMPRRPQEPMTLFAGTTSPPRFAFSALLI
jgi:hypothetical protein